MGIELNSDLKANHYN